MIERVTLEDGTVRWRARYGRNGQRKTFTRKGDAEEYVAEQARASRRRKAGLESARDAISFEQLYDLWVESAKPSDWTLSMAEPSLRYFRKRLVTELTTDQIGRWLSSLQQASGKPYSEKTKRHMLTALRQVLNAGVDYGYLSRSPASPRYRTSLSVPSDTRLREIRPFNSWDEVVAVADATTEGNFVKFCCLTGVRVPSEALTLRWDAVDSVRQVIKVLGTKTEGSLRTVPLCDEAMNVLSEMPRQIGGYIFVFDYEYWRRYEWPAALADAGLEKRTPYEMRHTFATLALQNGASIADVASAMGHTDIQRCFSTYRAWTKEMHDRLRSDLNRITISSPLAAQSQS